MRIARKVLLLMSLGLLGFADAVTPARAQEPFYKGKTIRLIVGLAPAGFRPLLTGIARHLGKHIPGSPTVVIDLEPLLVAKLKEVLK